jgi:putative oxidoreductase
MTGVDSKSNYIIPPMSHDNQPVYCSFISRLTRSLDRLGPVVDLLARCYVARVFLLSGWSKASDWSSTVFLFMNEYHVPLLPPGVAAIMATIGELLFGVMLLLGLSTRLAALGLFAVNFMAVISYYSELSTSPPAINDHIEWGIILATLMVSRTHDWSLDRVFHSCEKIQGLFGKYKNS